MAAPARAQLEAGLDLPTEARSVNSVGGGGSGGGGGGGSAIVGSFLLDALDRSQRDVRPEDPLHELLGEVGQVLHTAAFRLTVAELLDASFASVIAALHAHMQSTERPPAAHASGSSDRTQLQVGGGEGGEGEGVATRIACLPLAKVLAQLHHLAVETLSASAPHAKAVLEAPSLEEFCWLVYSGD